ncbi:PREDICTED: protein arginine N-methyltransferase 7 isoform X1 [Papilio xuthus]|uniref:Protein arginine N-methyltransferase n=2 Tax=Papilio xuthus TaxID=66420 RepID=A0AAJ6ZHC0_PAPXU|nr:PREDICTED: protein arginine N-methyltransferase 7 isoform X1 [Papilio xuthus]
MFSVLQSYKISIALSFVVRFKGCTTKTMQVFTQKRNPITGSTEWELQHENYDYHQEIARSGFADMLHDKERNQKYYRALRLAIKKMHSEGKKANVLDIGTGTGLLSIMAAKCGADSIVACEAFKPMAECCLKILQRNNVADKITLIPKRSTDIIVGENGDMKEKANILVTEVFDTELIGEGALSTFTHAHEHLLENDCIVVPDSAVIYAQVVECPTMQKWNKLNDLADEDLDIILRTPQKMKDCAGSAAVHDIQLSQLPRKAFRELSEQIPVFYYDWSGKTPIDLKKTVRQEFTVTNTGKAQMVFMWWELNMDTEDSKICKITRTPKQKNLRYPAKLFPLPSGTTRASKHDAPVAARRKIVLSCAPWWCHTDTDLSSERPQDTLPWRDHWMQAVYYLPQELTVQKDTEVTLISCQDEYSLWFYLEDGKTKHKHYKRPVCECGVHMTLSRTHVSYLNDGKRSKKFLARLKEELVRDAVVLDLNGSSLLGLAAAKLGAKHVFILEDKSLNIGILYDYMKENFLENVTIVSDVSDDILKEVTNVTCDPNFSNAILPWENLKVAYLLHKYRSKLRDIVSIIPEGCEFWAMPVEFLDLHKIRVPLEVCEGIDMTIFDQLVESSRILSDVEIEAQPLWEYPCTCRGLPRKLLALDFQDLKPKLATDGVNSFTDVETDERQPMNGFAVWMSWSVGGKPVSCGPTEWPSVGARVDWDSHTRQAVKILKYPREVSGDDKWNYQIVTDLDKGLFNITIDLEN